MYATFWSDCRTRTQRQRSQVYWGEQRKTLHGSLDAAQQLGDHHAQVLEAGGFPRCAASPCHFFPEGLQTYILVHGDEFFIVGRREERKHTLGLARCIRAQQSRNFGPCVVTISDSQFLEKNIDIATMENRARESWVRSRFAASMWIFSKAMICNGQDSTQECRLLKFRSIMEAVSWVCDDALDDHVCWDLNSHLLSGSKVLEALQYDLANPCLVQWGMLWFLAPTSLNRRVLNDGVIHEKYNEAINSAS